MNLRIDFKKELELASRGMIMIHDPRLLIKLIVRMIVRKLDIKHAAMILRDGESDSYVLNISRGQMGYKIPQGFTRFTGESPIIKIFLKKEYRPLTVNRDAILSDDINKMIWRESVINGGNSGNGFQQILHLVDEQLQMLNAIACVPAFYQDRLMAILLLGKKSDDSRFEQDELSFFAALASDAAMAIRNAQLFEGLKKEAERNRRLFLQTIKVLGSIIEAKDAYTHGHTERVTKLAITVARQMVANGSAEFSDDFFENLYIAGLLHDIGKIGVPGSILNKTGALEADEYVKMKEHAVRGAEIVSALDLPLEVIDGIRYHHERYDGKGYPDGRAGDGIPVTASILAVADTFDAMTSDRPYRKGLPKERAIEEIRKNFKTQFNPLPARALLELWDKGLI
jgi:putative nucleotidyltransferase with HDIG domain